MSMRLRRRATVTAGLAVAAVACAAAVSTAGPAAADALGDARARAAALAATVDRLQTRAEVATEHYDAAEAALGNAVVRQSLAERQAEADQAVVATARAQVDDRVRALYESGGSTSLFATVLAGSNPSDVASGLHDVGTLLTLSSDDIAAAAATTARAGRLAAVLNAATNRVTTLQRAAEAAAVQVQSLLDSQQQALAAATSQVRQLVAQQQAAAAAASAQDFQAALLAAGGKLPTNTTPPNAIAAGAIAAARSRLGDAYVWGATGPTTFDCSGLTQWAYAHVGVQLPRVAADQWNAGPHVAMADLEPGDLLFWATDVTNPATIHHVAIYLGAGMMLAAPHTGDVVKIQPVYLAGYIGATRPSPTSG